MESFSSTYNEARDKFLAAAQKLGAKIESIQHPKDGPNGESIFTDVALIGHPDPKNFFILGSGTHGVEGFTGSGIQTGLLRNKIGEQLEPGSGLLFIHAINPYGFAHLRRTNEDNIDLNRNFIDHSRPYPTNEGYAELAGVICPKSISGWDNIYLRLRFLLYQLKHGRGALLKAVSGDQFSHPEGLFFGGHHESWSSKTLKDIAQRYLCNARRVIFIDFHTGLGAFGDAEVILNVGPHAPEYKRAADIWGDRVKSTVDGGAVSVDLDASVKLAVPGMIPQAEVTAVSLEYGTYPPTDVFFALRAENWLHHFGGDGHPKSKKIKRELLRVFYPESDKWKLSVWNIGKEVVEQALNYLQPASANTN